MDEKPPKLLVLSPNCTSLSPAAQDLSFKTQFFVAPSWIVTPEANAEFMFVEIFS
jgi:hypothetical protein